MSSIKEGIKEELKEEAVKKGKEGIEEIEEIKEGLIDEIIDRYDGDPCMLIPMMQDIQAHYGYLPAAELRALSEKLKIPLSRVYSVATFYASFRHTPRGKHEVTLCMGTVCYLKGADRISKTICQEHHIQHGGTTADRLFTMNAVNCVGACALAPVMIVDGKYHDHMTSESALKIIKSLKKTEAPESKIEKKVPEKPFKPEKKPEKKIEEKGKVKVKEKVVGGKKRDKKEEKGKEVRSGREKKSGVKNTGLKDKGKVSSKNKVKVKERSRTEKKEVRKASKKAPSGSRLKEKEKGKRGK
jgi:NADH-quinone oxidoreductase subunit E